MGTQLDPEIARGVLRGDRLALARAYESLAQNVLNLAMRILQNRGLAEEVLQDTFVDLVEKSHQIRDADRISAWVRSVATNHCLMKLRSPWLARRMDLDADEVMDTQRADGLPAQTPGEFWPNIESALATLPASTRAVVWLHDVEGYTHKEIGQLMGKTTSFSKSQLARGYERLLAWSRDRDAQGRQDESKRGGDPDRRRKDETIGIGTVQAPGSP